MPVLSDAINALVSQSSYSASARNLAKEFLKYDSAALLSEAIFELSHSERQRRINTTAFASR